MAGRSRTTVIIVSMLFVGALQASAQSPLGSEFRVDTGGFATNSYQNQRRVAMAADGHFIVVWEASTGGFEHDVFARRFDATGVAQGPVFPVNTYTTGWQHDPSLGLDDAGNFVVVWASDPGGYPLVFGQRFDASGTRLGAEFTVSGGVEPSIAVAPGGDFVVAWEAGDAHGAGIRGRRYDASGLPVGVEFLVNTYTSGHQRRPDIDVDGAGAFVVVWDSGPYCCSLSRVTFGQRYTAGGVPQGTEFAVSSSLDGWQKRPRVTRTRDGSFVVAWFGRAGVGDYGVFARRFDASGLPLGADLRVSSHFPLLSNPDVDVDADGDFVVTWTDFGPDGSGYGIGVRRFDSSGVGGSEFRVNTYTTGSQILPGVASDPAGNFIVAWISWGQNGVPSPSPTDRVFAQRYAGGLSAAALAVDGSSGPTSDGNGVFEAGETVAVAPAWLNANFTAETFSGTASSFSGPGTPGDPTYTLADGAASYGTVASGATASCTASSDCYTLGVTVPSARPALHWDASVHERIAPTNLGAMKTWRLHIGDSFADVPRASGFYRFVETVLHRGITNGCSTTQYCPLGGTTREQMAVFVLVAKDGPGHIPPACTTPMFDDVPASSPFCPWIEELARRGVVGGCGGGNYCPGDPVSREEVAVFVLATKEPGVTPPACGTPMFTDVPASSPFCPWIEELARRGVVTGCGGGNYCPAAAVTREQMAVFISAGFGLQLYGP